MIPRYTRKEMAALWSDVTRYRTWLQVELAACRAMEAHDMVPRGTAAAIAPIAETLDPARIETIEQRTKHDVIAFLTHVEELAGDPARWLHLGLTSSDILDTASALLLDRACKHIVDAVDRLLEVLEKRARELKEVPMVGRTHGIHAEPTSCGLSFALWYAEMKRNRARLKQAQRDIKVGKIAGAVGTYANFPPTVEAQALAELALAPETVATQIVQRDRHAALVAALALTAATVEKIAVTVRGWQRTEVAEANEPFTQGQKGSSAMPHKKNPILSENLCGLARLVRGYLSPALENIALWHERDISHSSAERSIFPDATTTLHFMLHRVTRLLSGLVIHRAAMRRNLALTNGLIFSQSVLLALIRKGLARQQAYEWVQRCALTCHNAQDKTHNETHNETHTTSHIKDGTRLGTDSHPKTDSGSKTDSGFKTALAADPDISRHLSTAELDELFDLRHSLRHVDLIYERAGLSTE
jgi:adenylosuccinate lyase